MLNTQKPVDSKLVRFLTLLQFKTKYKKIKFLNVESFLKFTCKSAISQKMAKI
ncbi:hypothetical protein QM027_03860 [Campylobacter concisus]